MNKKRLSSCLLSAVLAAGMCMPSGAAFTDTEGHWAQDAVAKVDALVADIHIRSGDHPRYLLLTFSAEAAADRGFSHKGFSFFEAQRL